MQIIKFINANDNEKCGGKEEKNYDKRRFREQIKIKGQKHLISSCGNLLKILTSESL